MTFIYTPPDPNIKGPTGTGTYWDGYTPAQLRSEVERVRREAVEACIQKLNANTYNLTKAECISEIRELLK